MARCYGPRFFWTLSDISKIQKILPELNNPIVHICSGSSLIGDVRLDYNILRMNSDKHRGHANIKGDMLNIPLKSSIAGSVICDPPYTYDYVNKKLISELVRICKPKGKILFIAPWVPNHKNIRVIDTDLWNVGKNGAYHKIRTLFYKSNAQLSDFA